MSNAPIPNPGRESITTATRHNANPRYGNHSPRPSISLMRCRIAECSTAGANQLIRRSGIRVGQGTGHNFRANVEVPHLLTEKETLYFPPHMILVKHGTHLGSVCYSGSQIVCSPSRFCEERTVPADGRVIDVTWRYVNKNGGPDRRFNNNQKIPVLNYGRIALRSASGLRLVHSIPRTYSDAVPSGRRV